MESIYKEKIISEIDSIPDDMLPKFYRILSAIKTELLHEGIQKGAQKSLRGIWKNSEIDEGLFLEAKKSVFPYQTKIEK